MPIYEYECGSCGHRLESIQKMSDPVLQDCPACGKAALKKLISAAGFQLKGNGWYVTDFKKGGNDKPKQDSTDKSDASTGSSPEKKASGGCGHGGCGCAH